MRSKEKRTAQWDIKEELNNNFSSLQSTEMYFNLAKATLIVALTGSVAAWSMPWSNVNVARRDGYDVGLYILKPL